MKITTIENSSKKEDIQIQSGIHRLGLIGELPANLGQVTMRLRFVSATGGTIPIWDRMPLDTLLEISGSGGEGFYVQNTAANGNIGLRGSVVVAPDGVLNLQGGYLSLDVECAGPIPMLEIYAIDAPVVTSVYQRINPTSVQGVTKDIDLTGATGIVIPNDVVDSLQLRYADRSPEYTGAELLLMSQSINDLVAVDYNDGSAFYGSINLTILNVRSAQSARLVPKTAAQSYIYLLEEHSL